MPLTSSDAFEYHNWSERSACAAHEALQTGCMANAVATNDTVIFLSLSGPYFSPRRGCPRVLNFCV